MSLSIKLLNFLFHPTKRGFVWSFQNTQNFYSSDHFTGFPSARSSFFYKFTHFSHFLKISELWTAVKPFIMLRLPILVLAAPSLWISFANSNYVLTSTRSIPWISACPLHLNVKFMPFTSASRVHALYTLKCSFCHLHLQTKCMPSTPVSEVCTLYTWNLSVYVCAPLIWKLSASLYICKWSVYPLHLKLKCVPSTPASEVCALYTCKWSACPLHLQVKCMSTSSASEVCVLYTFKWSVYPLHLQVKCMPSTPFSGLHAL